MKKILAAFCTFFLLTSSIAFSKDALKYVPAGTVIHAASVSSTSTSQKKYPSHYVTNGRNFNTCNRIYYPRRYGTVVSSGTNFISRDIATGEVKQVVQVAPPNTYYY